MVKLTEKQYEVLVKKLDDELTAEVNLIVGELMERQSAGEFITEILSCSLEVMHEHHKAKDVLNMMRAHRDLMERAKNTKKSKKMSDALKIRTT